MKRPYLVAGPCSAESRAQILYTARTLKSKTAIDFFRAGVWKPRTRPEGFQGMGNSALVWLSEIQQELNLPVTTEVASPAHVEAVLAAGLKGVWIGARTSVNPFLVQDIASALAGTGIKVFVKNPINPDLELWIGALERFQKVGITDLVAIHRGFSAYGPKGYRNAPMWSIPIEFKRRNPQIPLLCDPSHIAGARAAIAELSQTALDLSFDGLMVEVHPKPEEALSDAQQQLNIADFAALLQGLILRTPQASDHTVNQRLEELRMHIDLVDDQIVDLLYQRLGIVEEIGLLKREEGMTILQSRRWEELIERIKVRGRTRNIAPEFLEQLFAHIHQEAIARQQRIMLGEEHVVQESFEQISFLEADVPEPLASKEICTVPQMGTLSDVPRLIGSRKAILVVDKAVDQHYGARLPIYSKIVIEAKEELKTLSTEEFITRELLRLHADRSTLVVGIGGGLMCDVAGFAASIYMRGLPFAFVPTTLLAQVDASIGGKNGVNFDRLKNMLGCIAQPQWILCDPMLLKTLPPQEIRSGLGEIIKHALIGDASLFEYIEQHAEELLLLQPKAIQYVISASQRLKCGVVNNDEREQGLRKTLNFGHTVGHAIEACAPVAGGPVYTHGEAVAVGMLFAVALSIRYTGFGTALLPRLKGLYAKLSLPITQPCPVESLCAAISSDKKRKGDSICFILLQDIGRPCLQGIPVQELPEALTWAQQQWR